MIKPIKLNVTRSLSKNKLYYSINGEKVDDRQLKGDPWQWCYFHGLRRGRLS